MNEKLKPCPFCGGEAELRIYSAELQFVQCVSCLAGSTAFHTGDEAISNWFCAKADELYAKAEKNRHEIRISRELLRKQLERNEQNEKR